MRSVKDIKDVQIVLNEILDWKQRLETKPNDMRGLPIKNLGRPSADSDAATLEDVTAAVEKFHKEYLFKMQELDSLLQKMKYILSELGYPVR